MIRGNEKSRVVYMDHSATTPTHPEVLSAMLPYYSERFGNPSSVYGIAREAKEALMLSREKVASALGASPHEIFFTAGGTEADNWAIKGLAGECGDGKNHVITTAIEHPAVLNPCRYLESRGFEVSYLPVDASGTVSTSDVEGAITNRTFLISVMFANNEIGTIEPVTEIGKIAKDHNICFHTDAVQAIGNIPVDVDGQNIDLLSLSAHKFYGPKGAGALYIREGLNISGFIHGGSQESGRRAGTENLPGIVGLGAAIERATTSIQSYTARTAAMRDRLFAGIRSVIPDTTQNGHPTQRLPGNLNVSFANLDGEALLFLLDQYGICASTGSACSSKSAAPSHVLTAIGLTPEMARGSLRLTLGNSNTEADIDYVLDVLPGLVERLRSASPFS